MTFLRWTFVLMAFVVASTVTITVHAGEELTEIYRDSVVRTLETLKSVGSQCTDCFTYSSGEERPVSACKAAYLDLYREETVDMRVVFGYMDSLNDSAIEDKYAADALREQVVLSCSQNRSGACGFKQVNDTLFEKRVRGPDGRMKTVRLSIVHSAASGNRRLNRTSSAQADATRAAEDAFYGGINQADVLFYAGHARKGGGPSFGPPHVNNQGRIDYPRYQRTKEGIKRTTDALRASTRRPKMLGIFACEADTLFGSQIAGATGGEVGTIMMSGLPSFDSMFGQVYAALDSALGMRCENEFNEVMRTAHEVNMPRGAPKTHVRLQSFFGNSRVARSGPGLGNYSPAYQSNSAPAPEVYESQWLGAPAPQAGSTTFGGSPPSPGTHSPVIRDPNDPYQGEAAQRWLRETNQSLQQSPQRYQPPAPSYVQPYYQPAPRAPVYRPYQPPAPGYAPSYDHINGN